MHDDYIVTYSVNFEKKEMVIQTYNSNEKSQQKIYFFNVLTHSFKCAIDYNIILDLQECEISCFIKDNLEELKKMNGYCWPIEYKTNEDLINFLNFNKYKYIKIISSYGMFGWILAKDYQIEE